LLCRLILSINQYHLYPFVVTIATCRYRYVSAQISITRSPYEHRDAWAPIEYYQCFLVAAEQFVGTSYLTDYSSWSLGFVETSELPSVHLSSTVSLNFTAYVSDPDLVEYVGCYAGSGDPSLNDIRLNPVGAVANFGDAAVPTSSAQSPNFFDQEERGEWLTGFFNFMPADSLPGLIRSYNISFGSASQDIISAIGSVLSIDGDSGQAASVGYT